MSAAVDAGVEVLALADHNDVEWIETMIEAGHPAGVVVFPGVEITTGSGADGVHLIIIGDPSRTRDDFNALLTGVCGYSDDHPRFDPVSNHPASSPRTAINILDDLPEGYLVIAPHVFNENGLMSRNTVAGDVRWKILHHDRLGALDIGDRRNLRAALKSEERLAAAREWETAEVRADPAVLGGRGAVLLAGTLASGIKTHARVYVNDAGDLVVEVQDVGKLVEELFGDSGDAAAAKPLMSAGTLDVEEAALAQPAETLDDVHPVFRIDVRREQPEDRVELEHLSLPDETAGPQQQLFAAVAAVFEGPDQEHEHADVVHAEPGRSRLAIDCEELDEQLAWQPCVAARPQVRPRWLAHRRSSSLTRLLSELARGACLFEDRPARGTFDERLPPLPVSLADPVPAEAGAQAVLFAVVELQRPLDELLLPVDVEPFQIDVDVVHSRDVRDGRPQCFIGNFRSSHCGGSHVCPPSSS